MVLQTLPDEVIQILIKRMSDEQSARYFYESAATWCRLNGYDNAAAHYSKEAADENAHYTRISNFLADWNTYPAFPRIAPPPVFESLQEIIEQTYSIEYDLGMAYSADAEPVEELSQMAYLFIQSFVQIQNDSIIEACNLVNKMQNYLKTDPGLVLFDNEVFE